MWESIVHYLSIEAVIALLVSLVAVGTNLQTIWKWGKAGARKIKPMFISAKAIRTLDEKLDTALEAIQKNSQAIQHIAEQIHINGAGESLRSALIRERELRWRDYELQGKMIWETGRLPNGEFGCVRATSALERVVGADPRGEGWKTALHPEDREPIERLWESAIDAGSSYQSLQRFVHRDITGKAIDTKYVWAHFVPEYDSEGTFRGGLGALELLTKTEYNRRKAKQDELEETMSGTMELDV